MNFNAKSYRGRESLSADFALNIVDCSKSLDLGYVQKTTDRKSTTLYLLFHG